MDSFDGSRRREGRAPSAPLERFAEGEPRAQRPAGARSLREPEPLEQRLDRWMSTGRQLVEGVSGGRPGSRPTGRRPEGRPGGRGGFDGLGRWVEDRLDWLLDDSDDWPEPWQERPGRRGESPPAPVSRLSAPEAREGRARDRETIRAGASAGGFSRGPLPDPPGAARPRRPLEAISRRGSGAPGGSASAGADQDWPDDGAFSLPRWQRQDPPVQRPDPLGSEREERRRPDDGGGRPDAGATRALPRSSRRR